MIKGLTLRYRKDLIGLVYVTGMLTRSRPITEEIEKLRKSDGVRGVVLRIDSPGGGVVASQEIYESILRLREKKKVFASCGSLAASGAYYVACAADKVYANPGSIVGSIGVIMKFPVIEQMLKKLGVETHTVKKGSYKEMGSFLRKMTPEEEKILQDLADDVYEQFIETVAASRKIDKEEVVKLAEGRIFSGSRARDIGLVDEIGSMKKTIQGLSATVGIPGEPKVLCLSRRKPPFLRRVLDGLLRSYHDSSFSLGYVDYFLL
jgi:protease-4